MRLSVRIALWSVSLTTLLAAVILASAGVGPVRVAPAVVAKVLLNSIPVPRLAGPLVHGAIAFEPAFAFDVPRTDAIIVRTVRLPRILLGAVVGFALAIAGAVMQGFFRNPMADPSIIGVSSGAAVGAVAALTLPVALPLGLELQTAAFIGGVLTAFAVYAIATEAGRTPVATLLLAGVAIQTFLGAVISFLLIRSGESMEQAVFWLMGHLHTATWGQVARASLLLPPFVAVLLLYSRDLNVLLLGEEDAATLGVDVERTKRVLLTASSIVTAAAVAVSGVIGFVGLIVPHMMRLLVGPDHRILLPTSALAGAAFLVVTDTVARSGPAELPVGIVTAAVGAPFFLYLLRRREVHAL